MTRTYKGRKTQAEKDNDEAVDNARAFANSIRGQFIISQALTVAARAIDNTDLRMVEREPSNAADMLYLRNSIFPLYSVIQEARDRHASIVAKRTAT